MANYPARKYVRLPGGSFFPLRRREWVPSPAADADRDPENTVAPVASGVAGVGEVLSVTDGTWLRARPLAFTYKWRRNGTPIAGAEASTYTTVGADSGTTVTCEVTARNMIGPVAAVSNGIAIP